MSLVRRAEEEAECGPSSHSASGLKIGAIFILLGSSLATTMFPIVCRRVQRMRIPDVFFDIIKYIGSGVILATGFIHLLEPAVDELGSPCLPASWSEYPYAFGITLISLYMTFVFELLAFRLGTSRLAKLGLKDSSHPHPHPQHAPAPLSAAEAGEAPLAGQGDMKGDVKGDVSGKNSTISTEFGEGDESVPAQLIGVAILEFGILFHSFIIGLTLAVQEGDEFHTLFIVIIFHQALEGLGLGARLAMLRLPSTWRFAPYIAGLAYAIITPLGLAIGLGVRESLALDAAGGAAATGVLDALSAGILIYTSVAELMAHEFILYNKSYHTCSWGKWLLSLICFGAGAGVMALIGNWA